MIKILTTLKNKPFSILIFLFITFLVVPYLIGNFMGNSIIEKLIIFLVLLLITIIIAEFLFLFLYKLYNGSKYTFIKKIPFEKLYVESHPYLRFTYKKNFQVTTSEKVIYPLHSNYFSSNLKSNNLGFFNGPNGDRDIIIPKPKDLIRVNCIGASTTGNYISENNNNFSYPLELEKILKLKSSKNIEVNNCGMGGYNSADLLVRFLLQIIDTEPDYLIIYHAYNDIRAYLTPNFSSDYSHSSKNFGEANWKFFVGSKIPDIPINFINFLRNKFFFSSNIRYSLLDIVAKNKIDPKIDFSQGLKTYKRNLQNIISISLNNKIEVVLCTFCIYLHKKIKNNPLHVLYEKIVLEENKIIKELAKKNNVKLVDCNSLISKEDSNFLDSCHFTPKGMNLLAKSISEVMQIK